MAFTLLVKQKKLFGKTRLDIPSLAQACGFKYGSNNEFYILQEEEQENNSAIFYNPDRIGRGIVFDGSRAGEGIYEVSYNIPDTRAEIADFVRLVKEMERRLGKVEMYCVEEERAFTSGELEEGIDRFAAFSLESLRRFCGNKEYSEYILSLALWPYTLPKEKAALWESCTELLDFEQTLHDLQSMDVYYAKPRLLQKNDTKAIGAFYVLTEECVSVFPVRADGFLNFDEIKIDEAFIQFFIYSEQRVMEGLYSYEHFIEEMKGRGAQMFDGAHILVPSMNKAALEGLAGKLGSAGHKL